MAKTNTPTHVVANSIEQLINNVITDTVDRVKTNGISGTEDKKWRENLIEKYLVKTGSLK